MRIGLVITTYNRPEYLKQCLESLREVVFPEDFLLLFIDDASTDEETLSMLESFTIGKETHVKYIQKNKGIHHSLLVGFNYLFGHRCELAMNLDADAIVKPDFIERLVEVQQKLKDKIVTGFNTLTPDPVTKRSRHPVVSHHAGYVKKNSIGGINMMMDEATFRKYLEPELQKGYNWDWRVCARVKNMRSFFAVTTPSCINHIGFDSTFSKHLNPDVAVDF